MIPLSILLHHIIACSGWHTDTFLFEFGAPDWRNIILNNSIFHPYLAFDVLRQKIETITPLFHRQLHPQSWEPVITSAAAHNRQLHWAPLSHRFGWIWAPILCPDLKPQLSKCLFYIPPCIYLKKQCDAPVECNTSYRSSAQSKQCCMIYSVSLVLAFKCDNGVMSFYCQHSVTILTLLQITVWWNCDPLWTVVVISCQYTDQLHILWIKGLSMCDYFTWCGKRTEVIQMCPFKH